MLTFSSAKDFLSALDADDLKQIVHEGLVKRAEQGSDQLLFGFGEHCERWIPVPPEAIARIEYLSMRRFQDRMHPFVRLFLRIPGREHATANFFAELALKSDRLTEWKGDRVGRDDPSAEVDESTGPHPKLLPVDCGNGPVLAPNRPARAYVYAWGSSINASSGLFRIGLPTDEMGSATVQTSEGWIDVKATPSSYPSLKYYPCESLRWGGGWVYGIQNYRFGFSASPQRDGRYIVLVGPREGSHPPDWDHVAVAERYQLPGI